MLRFHWATCSHNLPSFLALGNGHTTTASFLARCLECNLLAFMPSHHFHWIREPGPPFQAFPFSPRIGLLTLLPACLYFSLPPSLLPIFITNLSPLASCQLPAASRKLEARTLLQSRHGSPGQGTYPCF